MAGYCRVLPSPYSAATYGQPLGVPCRACERRVLMPLDTVAAAPPARASLSDHQF